MELSPNITRTFNSTEHCRQYGVVTEGTLTLHLQGEHGPQEDVKAGSSVSESSAVDQ